MEVTPVIPTLRRLGQKDLTFKVSLGYTARPCLKKKKKRPSPSLSWDRWGPTLSPPPPAQVIGTHTAGRLMPEAL
jgi:hypothetical protein